MVEDPENHAKMAITDAEGMPSGEQDIRFRVQFASSSREKSSDKFRDIHDFGVYKHNGMFKYTSGNLSSYAEAIQLQNKLRTKKKYRDAFIVAFKNEERIDVDEARKLSGQ